MALVDCQHPDLRVLVLEPVDRTVVGRVIDHDEFVIQPPAGLDAGPDGPF